MSVLCFSLLMVAVAPSFDALADRCIEVHRKSTAGAFSVSFSSTGTDQDRTGSYEVAYRRPDRLRYRAKMVPTPKSGSLDQSFILIGPNLYGVDHHSAQMLQRKVATKGSLPERFQSALALDEPIRVAVDPTGLSLFLSPLRELRAWHIETKGDRYDAAAATPNGTFQVSFSKSSGRLASVAIRSGSAGMRWSYTNWRSSPGTFTPPTGLRKVSEFYEAPALPKTADARTRELVTAVMGAYARLRHVSYRVIDNSGSTQVWLSDGAARQVTEAGEWSWQGGTLRIAPRGSGVQAVRGKLKEVEDRTSKFGMPIEPMLHRFLQGRNPLATVWKQDLQARIVGNVNVGAMRGTIIELKSPGIRITAIVRGDNRLLHSITTDSLDGRGGVVTSSERRFEYRSVGKPLPTLGR